MRLFVPIHGNVYIHSYTHKRTHTHSWCLVCNSHIYTNTKTYTHTQIYIIFKQRPLSILMCAYKELHIYSCTHSFICVHAFMYGA